MKVSDAVSGVTRLGIDTAPFIYLVEKHPRHFTTMKAILDHITNNVLVALSSTLTLTEVLTLPIRLNKLHLATEYEAILLNSARFQLVPLDTGIARVAADLRAQYDLKTPDAIQVGTALASGCQAFVTNDLGLKRVSELRVLILDEIEPV